MANYEVSNFHAQGDKTNRPHFSLVLYELIEVKKRKCETEEEIQFNRYEYDSKRTKLLEKANALKIILESINDNLEKNKILRLTFKRYTPKSKDFYKLFVNLSGGNVKNEFLDFKNIIASKHDNEDKKSFDFIIKDVVKTSNRIKDIIKLIDSEDWIAPDYDDFENKNKTLNKNEFNTFGFSTFKHGANENGNDLYGIKSINEIENILIMDNYSILNEEIINGLRFKQSSVKVINKDIDHNGISFENISNYRVGILDSKIHEDFEKKYKQLSIFEYQLYVEDEEKYLSSFTMESHAEAVASIVMFGDQINGFIDSIGITKVKVCSVLSENKEKNSMESVIKRIKTAVEDNEDIKIWNLSLGVESLNSNEFQITPIGIFLDKLMIEKGIKFIISGGNDNRRTGCFYISPPADSELAITVNSLDDIDGDPASYSLLGYYGVFGNKPTLSFFGGDSRKRLMKVAQADGINEIEGTSFASPFIARYYSKIYFDDISEDAKNKEYLIEQKHSYVEALMISRSIMNTEMQYFNENSNIEHVNKLGAGKYPIEYENEINFTTVIKSGNFDNYSFNQGESLEKKFRNRFKKHVPIPKLKNGKRDYWLSITIVDVSEINHNYGCDYSVTSSKASLKWERNENFSKSKGVLATPYYMIPDEDNKKILEKQLVKDGKWSRLYCAKYNISKLHKNVDEFPDDYLNLTLEKNNRYTKEKDFESIVIISYKPFNPEHNEELLNQIVKIHKSNGHDLNEIDVFVDADPV